MNSGSVFSVTLWLHRNLTIGQARHLPYDASSFLTTVCKMPPLR